MKVLMISGDPNLLKEGSAAHARLALQRSAVEQLDVFVWPSVHSKGEIWRAARKNRYDVVTSQDPFWRGLLAWKIARLTGTKLNVQVHADLAAQSLVRRLIAKFVLRHTDSIRVVSEKLRIDIGRLGMRGNVHVLPVFIDVERFRDLSRLPHEGKVILWMGRFEEEKDPLAALSILKEVREKGIDARLVMLGSGSLEEKLKREAKDFPVEFPGWQDPLPFLARADAVLCTSRTESYGASIIEASAAGVPVVAPDVGVAREAGAIVVDRSQLAEAVASALTTGARGALALNLPSAEVWADRWRESL